MPDLTRLLSSISLRTAAGITLALAALGGAGATVVSLSPAASQGSSANHSTQKPESSENAESSEKPEASEAPESAEASETADKDAHGDAVVKAVASCKAAAEKAGTHGIGACVSKVASGGRSHNPHH